jgi:hypothetical protein
MKKQLLVLIFLVFSTVVFSQEELLGQWTGIITQDEGGYRSEYGFELYLKKKGNLITGRSYVYVDNIYAEMSLSGFFVGSEMFHFTESRVMKSRDLPTLEWCLKGGELKLERNGKGWILSGRWQGVTPGGNCIPGEIILKKVVPRV